MAISVTLIHHSNQILRTIIKTVSIGLIIMLLSAFSESISVFAIPTTANFSVRGYGAIGDGISDDAPAVRRAIAEAAKSGGGNVHFPAGTYLLKKAELGGQILTLPSKVNLVSDESAKLIDAGHPSLPGSEWSTGPLVRIIGESDCTIRGLHFSGPGQAIYMRNVKGILIENCQFKEHTPMAIYGDRTSEVEVQNCLFENVGYGIYLRSPVMWRVNDNRFLANGRAMESHGAVSCEISGNFIDGKGKDGEIHGIVGLLFFPNSMGTNDSAMDKITRTFFDMLAGNPTSAGASTVGNLITNNEVRNVREEGISLDCRGNHPMYYYGLPGMVSNADENSITDASNEAEELKFAPTCYMALISGKGAGQYRLVEKVQGKKLFISPKWETIPDSTSRYSLLRAAVGNKIIRNKVVNAKLASIMLWGACLGNEVIDNIIVGSPSGGIVCASLRPTVYKGMSRILSCFNNRIINNQVNGTKGIGKGNKKKNSTSGIILTNMYGGIDEVHNYNNTVINNTIKNFNVGIDIQIQNNALVQGNTIENCDLTIKTGDKLINSIIK